MSVAQRSEGVGRGMTCSPDDLPVTCSSDDHVMTPWSPPGDYLLFPLFGNLLFWMTPPPTPARTGLLLSMVVYPHISTDIV